MKNNTLFLSAILSFSMLSACVKTSDISDLGYFKPSEKWAAYKASALSGTVFNQIWTSTTALVKPISGNPNEVSLEFYSEDTPVSCTSSSIPKKPYATIVLPAEYQAIEYVADMQNMSGGNPLVFTSFAGSSKNEIADQTKLWIQSIDANGFKASLYAKGLTSEVNGTVSVKDCRKAVDFSVWDNLVGWYKIIELDGVTKTSTTAIIDYDKNYLFYDSAAKKYIKTLIFPLFTSVGSSSSSTVNFGPMDGYGTTKLSESGGKTTLTYSFHGKITYRGTPTQIELDMEVVKQNDRLNISYTFEVPGEVNKTSHRFVLVK